MKRMTVGLMALVVGCTAPAPQAPSPTLTLGPDTNSLPVNHPAIGGGAGGGVATGGGSGGAGGGVMSGGGAGGSGGGVALPVSYGTRRLTLAQVEKSVKAIFGNDAAGNPITWKVGAADGFTSRGPALGVPDYLATVEENMEPSPTYVKFMQDMARSVCNQALLVDPTRAAADRTLTPLVQDTDTLVTAPLAIDANLRALKLKFHGVKVADTDTQSIADLRILFARSITGAATTADGGMTSVTPTHIKEGWRTVCVALLTAPEFHLY